MAVSVDSIEVAVGPLLLLLLGVPARLSNNRCRLMIWLDVCDTAAAAAVRVMTMNVRHRRGRCVGQVLAVHVVLHAHRLLMQHVELGHRMVLMLLLGRRRLDVAVRGELFVFARRRRRRRGRVARGCHEQR